MVEQVLQNLLLARLSRLPAAMFWRMNTGGAQLADGRVIRFGMPGQADITGVLNGRRVEIECKSTSGSLSPEQREFGRRISGCGGLYVVAKNLKNESAQDTLDRIGKVIGVTL